MIVARSIYETGKYILTGLSVSVCFTAFAWFVKPEISKLIIPRVVSLSQSHAADLEGLDLDPIYLSGSERNADLGGLYITKYGYVGDGLYGELVTADTRVVAMHRFLIDHGSPMAGEAETFVSAADDVGLDWRLVASISGVESAFGQLIPYNSYNGWGWRGGPGGDFSNFGSWEAGIRYVTTRIAEGYGTTMSVFTMEPIYCPPCGMNPEHAWANGVAGYMAQLDNYRREL